MLVPVAIRRWGPRAFVIVADRTDGGIAARWIDHYASRAGGAVVGISRLPEDAIEFGSVLQSIRAAEPHVLITALAGRSNIAFTHLWAVSELRERLPLASLTFGRDNEHRVFTAGEGDGLLLARSYLPEIASSTNTRFLNAWRGRYGETTRVNEPAVSSYQSCLLWTRAVGKAGAVSRDGVVAALENGLSIDGPAGKVTVDRKTHHTVFDIHLIELLARKMTVVDHRTQVPPLGTQRVCDLTANPDDATRYEIEI